ncbi:Nn.00g053310.m01.CDS01 [Neocucurbitaria sp. VM-36]
MPPRLSRLFAAILAGICLVVSTAALPNGPYEPILEPRYLETTDSRNLKEHIEVYSIPYGVLGVISHGLTFYVILCHLLGRQPLLPWKFLEKERWNLAVVSVSSLISIIISGVTLARTRGSRPLMILAGMQIVLNALIDFIHIHRMVLKAQGWSKSISFWAIPLLVVSIFSVYAFYQFPFKDEDGKTGTIFKSIVLIVLLAWIGLTGLATLLTFLASVFTWFKDPLLFAVSAIFLSCALFWLGDFGIALVSKNSIGTPSNQIKALYYTFWVVERLPLFTF